MMLKTRILLLLGLFLGLSNVVNSQCFDASIYDPDAFCTLEYNPVCVYCDGAPQEFGNPCQAYVSGYNFADQTPGQCGTPPCSVDATAVPKCTGTDGTYYVDLFVTGTSSYSVTANNGFSVSGILGGSTIEVEFFGSGEPYEIIVTDENDSACSQLITGVETCATSPACSVGAFFDFEYISSIGTDDIPQSYGGHEFCINDLSTVDPNANIIAWEWDLGEGTTSTNQNPCHTFPYILDGENVNEPYNICLTITAETVDSSNVSTCSDTYCYELALGGGEGCVNPANISTQTLCGEYYFPVCGCNGIFYENDCYATEQAGVTSFEEGECESEMVNTQLFLKVLLEGAYDSQSNGLMNSVLDGAGLLTEHPYMGEPYNYTGPDIDYTNIPENAVDFILIELREDFGMPAAAQQVAYVVDNGDIFIANGELPSFDLDPNTTYQVWIRHHNHLDVVGAEEITPIGMIVYDFLDLDDVQGPQQLKEVDSGIFAMYAGDFNRNGSISVTDFDDWALNPAILNQYQGTDANLDGVVQVSDFDIWFDNKAKIGFAQNQ